MNISKTEIRSILGPNDQLVPIIDHVGMKNPYDPDKDEDAYIMWEEQCNINFPILYMASIFLYIFAKQKNCKVFLFATRDCCHWYNIFKKIFPNEKSYYFHCSRNMFSSAAMKNNIHFKTYIQSMVGDNLDDAIYVDIHGSGQHLFHYFNKAFNKAPYCFLLSSSCEDYDSFPSITRKYHGKLINLIFGVRGGHIEMLNYDLVGTLQNYSSDGPIRDKLEYELNQVIPYHKCIDAIVEKLMPLPSYTYDLTKLHHLIKKIFMNISENRPLLTKYIHHIGRHKKIKKSKSK